MKFSAKGGLKKKGGHRWYSFWTSMETPFLDPQETPSIQMFELNTSSTSTMASSLTGSWGFHLHWGYNRQNFAFDQDQRFNRTLSSHIFGGWISTTPTFLFLMAFLLPHQGERSSLVIITKAMSCASRCRWNVFGSFDKTSAIWWSSRYRRWICITWQASSPRRSGKVFFVCKQRGEVKEKCDREESFCHGKHVFFGCVLNESLDDVLLVD